MKRLPKHLRAFRRNEDGTLTVELVLVLPILIWAFAGLYAYWDSYRVINVVQKASYTVADLISRSQGKVDDNYIAGMRTTMNYLIDPDQQAKIRVTSFLWNDINKRYEVIWSRSPGNAMQAHNRARLNLLKSNLPVMSDGDTAVLVETEVPYVPALNYGMAPTTIKQFIVTRPRFLPRVCHVSYGSCPAVIS